MNKKICMLLALLMMLMMLASCSGEPAKSTEGQGGNTGTVSTAPVSTENPNERKFIKDSLPDNIDFGGETIKIYCRAVLESQIVVPEKVEDIINDAVYDRLARVEDRLNINVEMVPTGANATEAYNAVNNVIKSGADQIDLAFLNPKGGTLNLAMDGALANLSQYTDILDFSQPWWSDFYKKGSSINDDASYFAIGHSSQTYVTFGTGLALNSTIYEEKVGSLDDLYQLVLDGKWTLDKYKETIKVYEDLDGGGKKDENDFNGYFTKASALEINDFLISSGFTYTEVNDKGVPEFTINTSKNMEILKTIYDLFHEEEGFYSDYSAADGKNQEVFKAGKALTIMAYIRHLSNFRDMEDDYTMIPYPKYNEDQEEYRTYLSLDVAVWMIPNACSDIERAATFLEAFSSDSYNYVTPQIYETAFKNAYSRDPMMGKMLDIVVGAQYTDFALTHVDIIPDLYYFFWNQFKGNNDNFTSAFDSKSKAWDSALQSIIEKYQDAF